MLVKGGPGGNRGKYRIAQAYQFRWVSAKQTALLHTGWPGSGTKFPLVSYISSVQFILLTQESLYRPMSHVLVENADYNTNLMHLGNYIGACELSTVSSLNIQYI